MFVFVPEVCTVHAVYIETILYELHMALGEWLVLVTF